MTLLLGGARSGKSTLAVSMAKTMGLPTVYIATAEPGDDEMAARIKAHRDQRPEEWTTIEDPHDVTGALARVPGDAVVILDCLTLWVSNLISRDLTDDDITDRARAAAAAAAGRTGSTIAISNEVGSGIVPMHPLSRRYRDLLGIVNAMWAENAERAYLVVAGRSLALSAPADPGGVLDG